MLKTLLDFNPSISDNEVEGYFKFYLNKIILTDELCIFLLDSPIVDRDKLNKDKLGIDDFKYKGIEYSFEQIFVVLDEIIEKLKTDLHILFTGRLPIEQQERIIAFCQKFEQKYGFVPTIELDLDISSKPYVEIYNYVKLIHYFPQKSINKSLIKLKRNIDTVIKDIESDIIFTKHNNVTIDFYFIVNDEEEIKQIKQEVNSDKFNICILSYTKDIEFLKSMSHKYNTKYSLRLFDHIINITNESSQK